MKKVKKPIACLLAALLIFSTVPMSALADEADTPVSVTVETNAEKAAQDTEPDAEPKPESTAEPTATPEASTTPSAEPTAVPSPEATEEPTEPEDQGWQFYLSAFSNHKVQRHYQALSE